MKNSRQQKPLQILTNWNIQYQGIELLCRILSSCYVLSSTGRVRIRWVRWLPIISSWGICYVMLFIIIGFNWMIWKVRESGKSQAGFFKLTLGCEIGLSPEMGFRWVRVEFGDASWISWKYKIYVIFRYKMIGDIKKMSLSYAKCPSGDLHNG